MNWMLPRPDVAFSTMRSAPVVPALGVWMLTLPVKNAPARSALPASAVTRADRSPAKDAGKPMFVVSQLPVPVPPDFT
jgi:hypothetical protein